MILRFPYPLQDPLLFVFGSCANWDVVETWFKHLDSALAVMLKNVKHARVIFLKRHSEDMAAVIYKLYYEEQDHYIEEIRTRTVPEKELPPWAKVKLDSDVEVDITDEIERELKERC